MARKKRGFQWTREDQDEQALERVERRDAAAGRAERRTLEELSLRLAAMTPGRLAQLPLEPEALEGIAILARQGPKSSRRRQLLRVAGLLRGTDLDALESAMDGNTADADREYVVESLHRRMLDGGDAELQDFLDRYPAADRQQLRTLLRGARGAGAAAERSSRKLLQAMREAARADSD